MWTLESDHLHPNPASNTYKPCDLGNAVKCSVPRFPHVVVGMSHEHTEQCLEHSVEATLVAAKPHPHLTPGLLLQCSICWVRHAWMLTHAGWSLEFFLS